MNDQNKNVLLHLSLIPGIGVALAVKAIKGLYFERYPDLFDVDLMELIQVQDQLNLEKLYGFTVHDFVKRCGFSEKCARELVHGLADKSLLENELTLIEKFNVSVVTIFETAYPEILKQIYLPPIVLYCKGAPLLPFAKRFSIVGSRRADAYAQHVINSIVPAMVTRGWHIVSGGAEGVDTMAHVATLNMSGRTIVVLGSGFMHLYPKCNEDLFAKISANNGTLISPFSLNTRPDKGTFPARNRVIAGLSQGCLVVRAAEKSGALITAQFALDQGRLVFAVPGSIYDDLSHGCHELIKQGAKLVNEVHDILEDFGEGQIPVSFQSATVEKSLNPREDVFPARETGMDSDPILVALATLCTIDELSDKTGLALDDLQNKLFELQLDGKVRQNFTGMWERV